MEPSTKRSNASVLLVVTLAIFADMFVYGLLVPIVPVYATELGASQTAIGILFGCYAAALLIMTPIFGVLSDRLGRRSLLISGAIGLFVATLLFANANSVFLLAVARTLQGIAAAATWGAGFALLADVYPSEQRGKTMSIALSGMILGTLLGPALGGLLNDHEGRQFTFYVSAALPLLVLAASILALRKVPLSTVAEHHSNPFQLLRDRTVVSILFIVLLGAFIPGLLEPTLPLYLHQNLHASASTIGFLFVVSPLTYVFCAPVAGILSGRVEQVRLMAIGLVLMAIALPLISIANSYLLEIGALLILGIGIGFGLTPSTPELAQAVDRRGQNAYGVAFALYNLAYFVGLMVGPVFGGLLTNQFHLLPTLLMAAGIVIIGAIVLLVTNRHKVSLSADVQETPAKEA